MKKEAFIVCSALFLLLFGAYISAAVLVPYTEKLGGTSLTVGIVYSSMYAVRLFFCVPIGRLSQRVGAKRVLTYSLMPFPLIAAGYLVSWNLPSLLFARVLHGFVSAMLLPMAMAYIGELSPVGREGRYMAVYNAICFASSAAGPVVGGFIYDSRGAKWAFASLLALALLAFLLVAFTVERKRNKPAESPRLDLENDIPKPKPSRLFTNRKMLSLGCLNVTSAMLLALLGASFTELALSWKMSMGFIGILVAAYNIAVGVTQFPFGRLTDRSNKAAMTLISGVAAALLFVCLPLAGGSVWAVVPLIAAIGLAASLNLSASSALSAVLGRELGMSNTMGFLATANSAGTIAAFLSLGAIADWLGINSAFWFAAGVSLAGTVGFYWLWDHGKKVSLLPVQPDALDS